MKKLFLALIACCGISWVQALPAELFSGDYRLSVYPETGSFSLARLSPTGKNRYEALFEDRNSASTNWFSVFSNGRVFALVPRGGNKPSVIAEDSSITVIFVPSDDFQVTQRFSFIGSPSEANVSLSIVTTVENTSGKTGTFALKALIDTNLGETQGVHFKTDRRERLSSETELLPAQIKDRWLSSPGKTHDLVFPFASWPIMPERIVIANWERLKTLSWNPPVVEGRSFNTLYSVSDSALLFLWPQQTVGANKTLSAAMTLGGGMGAAASFVNNTSSVDELIVAGGNRNEVIERILARIAEIERNPESASDAELQQLNELLDTYLTETEAP